MPNNCLSGQDLFRRGAADYGLHQGQSNPTRAAQQGFLPSNTCWAALVKLDCGTLLEAFKLESDDASKIGSQGAGGVWKWDSSCLRLALRHNVHMQSQISIH